MKSRCCSRPKPCDCAERDRIARERIEAAGLTHEAVGRMNFAETVALAERLGIRPQEVVGYWFEGLSC